jgi:hypothetical protein
MTTLAHFFQIVGMLACLLLCGFALGVLYVLWEVWSDKRKRRDE